MDYARYFVMVDGEADRKFDFDDFKAFRLSLGSCNHRIGIPPNEMVTWIEDCVSKGQTILHLLRFVRHHSS